MRLASVAAWASTFLLLAAKPAVAQETAAQVAPTEAAPAEAAPTMESLRAEIREADARQAQEIQRLKDEIARREDEASVAHEREAAEHERLLRVYGFADFGIMRTIAPKDAMVASEFTTPLTFYLGRLNLYYDAHPDPDFRFLAETRLTLYPNGTSAGVSSTGQVIRTSTAVGDISSPNASASVTWGSIILERAVLDWTRYPLFSVRAGLFLTPFGIYNVDHGSPTLISMTLPSYLSQNWIPARQLGVQIFGSYPIAPWELGYALTVSNGASDGILDVGDSKAYGGRIFARRQGELSLTLGGSLLYQPYRQNKEQFGLAADGSMTYTVTRVVERTGLTLGGDLSVDFRGFRLRSEFVMYQVNYTAGKRALAADDINGGYSPDMRNVNWYVVAAYRVWRLEPYVLSDLTKVSPVQATLDTAWGLGGGLNVYLRSNVIVKLNWAHAMFFRENDPNDIASRQNFDTFVGMLVWAF
jgi:hypothetical protein